MNHNAGASFRRLSTFLLFCIFALGLGWGIATSFAADSSPSPGGKVTLRVGWTAEPDSLNPFQGQVSPAYEVWHLNWDFLVGFDASLQPRPELATSWSHSADGKVWTFKVRRGVKWQDGVPFTARDVAFTFNYIIKNQMSNFTVYTDFLKSVKAVDDYTVEFDCTKPKPNMLGMVVPIVPEHIWSNISPEAAARTFQNTPPIVGTGPFQVVEWKKGQYVKMEANPDYWRGRPKVDELILQYYTNPDNMVADLKSGALQVAIDVPSAQFGPLAATRGIKPIGALMNGINDLGFNCYTGPASLGNPVLKDPAFRRALNYAVDREAIVKVAYFGHATPGSSIIRSDFYVPTLDYHWQPPADQLYAFDLGKAKAALDAAGYRDTNGDGIRDYRGEPIVLRLYVRAQSETDQRAGKLIAGWFDQIGLKIKLAVIDEGRLNDVVWNMKGSQWAPDFDMFLWYWQPDPDPNFMVSVLTKSQIGGWSDTWWVNADYDRLFLKQETTIDPQARKQIIWQMEQIAYRESPYIVYAYPQVLEAYNDRDWTGWVTCPPNNGGVVANMFNVDSYIFVHPQEASTAGRTSSATWIVLGVVAAVVAAVGAFAVWRRRRGGPEEV